MTEERFGQPLAAGEAARFFTLPAADAVECLVARFHTHAYVPHTHDDYVIGAITAGRELFHIGRAAGSAAPGDLVLIDPGVVHDGAPGPGGYVYRMTYPSPAVMAEVAGEISGRAPAPPRFAVNKVHDPALAARLAGLHAAAEAGADRMALDQEMLGVMAQVIARHAENGAGVAAALARSPGREAAALARARAYLDAHFAEAVDLATLAAVSGLPRSRLIRALRRECGLTPHALLVDRRVKAARALLAAGTAPAEAALACGFCDQSHLNRAFKARIGVTPGFYRRARA
ncbi:AraC family transcriptional regulator [Zavarzinia sp.]|uniref:AraC family transcriptional regulator n=1 Tax=Zavarzinia sp. TaxID=2027920 RepID=UPI00356514DA